MVWVRWGTCAGVLAALLIGCGSDGTGEGWQGSSGEDTPSSSSPSSGPEDDDGEGTTTGGETDPDPTEADGSSSSGEVPPDPGDPFDPVPPYEPLSEDAVAGLQASLDAVLDGGALGGASQGVLVVDLETDQVLYERNPDQVWVPASNTKMFTTAATSDILSPEHRAVTQVWADAAPDGAGAIAGDLHLIGNHDFTWSTRFYGSARDPLDRIAAALFDAGVRSVSGGVVARGEFCYEGQSLGDYSVSAAGHRSTAAARFRDALVAAGISVSGGTNTSPDFDPPAGASELVSWLSPPLSSMSVPINVSSHNEFADIQLRHLGLNTAGQSTYAAGGQQIVDWMASLPTDNSQAVWEDGSGLDHDNRTSARNIVDLIRFMEGSGAGDRWMRTMAIAGVRGTLGSRMTGPTTIGRFWGKTGTLPSIGVVSLSGILFHRDDGRRYAISILFNGVPNVTTARSVQNDFVTAVAADHHAVGGRPASPTLLSARGAASDVVELSWSAVEGADGYAVWVSPDGESWSLDDARRVDDTSHRAGELPYDGDVYFRVTSFVEAAGAVHSVPSDVYASTSRNGVASVLVVDGNDRWQAQPVGENPRGVGHGFVARYAEAMSRVSFDTVANEVVADEMVDLADYDAVLWMLGEESDADLSFDALEQSVLQSYVEGGGGLLVSGAEFAYDLGAVGTPEDAAFMADVLHVTYVGDDAATWWMQQGSGPFEDAPPLGFNTRDGMVIDFPDQLGAAAGGEEVLSYRGGVGGVAAIAYEGTGRTLALGVPFESIEGIEDRIWMMTRVLDFLSP